MRTDFRFAMKTLVAGLALSIASVAMAQVKTELRTVRVGTYGGPWQQAVHASVGAKLESMGIKVEYVTGNPAENLAKITAARGTPPIDVMEMGPSERITMKREALLEDLPTAKILNVFKISLEVADKKTIKHQIDRQTVAHQIVQNGILIRKDLFATEKLPSLVRFEDLMHPKLAGRTAFPAVTNPQHWPVVSSLASEAGGGESKPDPGFRQAVKMRPLYFYASTTELAQKLGSGEIVAAPSHAGMAVRLHRAGMNVDFVHPQVGAKLGEVEYNYLGIVKGTKNLDAAAAFINVFLDTQPQADFARSMGVVPVNREARQMLLKDPVLSRFLLLGDRDLANAYSMNWEKVDIGKWRSTWADVTSK